MNPLIATHYSTGDALQMLAMLILPSALAVATFSFAVVVWKRRKELGFLLLAIGVGLQALLVCIPAFFLWQGESTSAAMLNYVWLYKLPSLISLIG
jgi:hypothetical protein